MATEPAGRFAEFDRGAKITAMDERIREPAPILKKIGAIMTGRFVSTFVNQGRGRVKWKRPAPIALARIIVRANRGEPPKGRDFDATRQALVDTGALRNSISFRVLGKDTVEIGSALPYAEKHHKDHQATFTLTDSGRTFLVKWLKSNRQKIGTDAASAIGAIFGIMKRDGSWTIKVPARPFAFLDQEDRKHVAALVGREIGLA